MRCLFRLEAEEEENYKDLHLPDILVFVWVMAVAVWILTVLSMAAVCQAAPSRPVGYYTFDGKSLRPLNVVQRRSDDDGFSFGERYGWKLHFAKPSFLSALTDRGDDDERPTVSSDHLLPDYLTASGIFEAPTASGWFFRRQNHCRTFPRPLWPVYLNHLRVPVPLLRLRQLPARQKLNCNRRLNRHYRPSFIKVLRRRRTSRSNFSLPSLFRPK